MEPRRIDIDFTTRPRARGCVGNYPMRSAVDFATEQSLPVAANHGPLAIVPVDVVRFLPPLPPSCKLARPRRQSGVQLSHPLDAIYISGANHLDTSGERN
jgi:hypothetical protein